jgi:hypothetical protein
MEYDNKLIDKAKASRCKICQEYITEQEAIDQEFQATQTHRGVLLRAYPVPGQGI